MIQTNRVLNLADEPLDSEHILACARTPYLQIRDIVEAAGKGKWLVRLQERAPLDCCKDPANLDLEAWYSMRSEADKETPDIYKFHCRVCEAKVLAGEKTGMTHVFFCVGYDERPMWEVR